MRKTRCHPETLPRNPPVRQRNGSFFRKKEKGKKRKEKKRKEKKRCHPETIRKVRLYETGCVLLFGKSKKK